MREAHVECGVPVEDATEHERRRGQRLFVRVAHDEVEPEPSEPPVLRRAAPVVGHAVDEQRHVEFDDPAVDVVEAGIVEGQPVLGADVGGDEAEFTDRPVEFDDRRVGILQRELRRSEQPIGMLGNERRHRVVGRPGEVDRRAGLDTAEEGQRVRRQHLAVDSHPVHLDEAALDVHEHAAAVRDRLHRVVAHTEELATVRVGAVGGPVVPAVPKASASTTCACRSTTPPTVSSRRRRPRRTGTARPRTPARDRRLPTAGSRT